MTTTSFEEFRSRFRFGMLHILRAGLVGVERESFLAREGAIVPEAPAVLGMLRSRRRFGYELSACQIEDRVRPTVPARLRRKLWRNDTAIAAAANRFGLDRVRIEVAPADMPLDVYPDPTGRYQEIVRDMPSEILRAACRVAGTHVHVGMPDADTALSAYNAAVRRCADLCRLAGGLGSERLTLYRLMAPAYWPSQYASWKEFHERACDEGFAADPRKCWDLIRLTVHGTVEFRMFGATADADRVVEWATACQEICATELPEPVGLDWSGYRGGW